MILVSGVQSALDPSIRIAVERTSEAGISLLVDRNRLGTPGRSSQGELGGDFAPPVARARPGATRKPIRAERVCTAAPTACLFFASMRLAEVRFRITTQSIGRRARAAFRFRLSQTSSL